jgi:hypothetical protein
MTRLQSYILNEGRGTGIYFDEAEKILNTKCKKALKAADNGTTIWRGIQRSVPYYLIKPLSNDLRPSRNTENYYTLIINNDTRWRGFPKRQIICSTNRVESTGYGNAYVVFPFDGAKIGVCPKDDMWISFEGIDVSYLNSGITSLLGKEYTTYSSLKAKLSSINISDVDVDELENDYGEIGNVFRRFGDTCKTAWEAILEAYSPIGFDVVNVGSKLPKHREVWTDAPCLMVHDRLGKELIG